MRQQSTVSMSEALHSYSNPGSRADFESSGESTHGLNVSILRYVFRRLASSCSNQLFRRVMKLQVLLKKKAIHSARIHFVEISHHKCSHTMKRRAILKSALFRKQKLRERKIHCICALAHTAQVARKVRLTRRKMRNIVCRQVFSQLRKNVWFNSGVLDTDGSAFQASNAVAISQRLDPAEYVWRKFYDSKMDKKNLWREHRTHHYLRLRRKYWTL